MDRKSIRLSLLLVTTLALGLLLAAGPAAQAQGEQRVSEFGRYAGYSERSYDGYERFSQYVEVRDGTRLAVDIYRPTLNGHLHTEPLPVIWTHTRYQRATQLPNGQLAASPDAGEFLLPYGYIIGVVDVRGGGASFGVRDIEFSPAEAQDAYDITEWFAAQPWSDGNIGMFGRSYLGITQLFAAAQAPPHLRAIMPEMHMFDLYDLVHQNGIYLRNFIQQWDYIVRGLD
ncbi:MAG: CocE/NonD family hydrolase, partial [Anaerolineae bacterium]|nr:CocE/NonD family hydrolase [Anaerolineae bacterium]